MKEIRCKDCGITVDELLGTGEKIARRKDHNNEILCDLCTMKRDQERSCAS
jgi:hypothetical protein